MSEVANIQYKTVSMVRIVWITTVFEDSIKMESDAHNFLLDSLLMCSEFDNKVTEIKHCVFFLCHSKFVMHMSKLFWHS